jgi:hypothetical protein
VACTLDLARAADRSYCPRTEMTGPAAKQLPARSGVNDNDLPGRDVMYLAQKNAGCQRTHEGARSLGRAILEETVRPEGRVKIGSALAAFGRRFGGIDLDVTRDQSAPRAASFE